MSRQVELTAAVQKRVLRDLRVLKRVSHSTAQRRMTRPGSGHGSCDMHDTASCSKARDMAAMTCWLVALQEANLGLEVEDCECLTDWVVKVTGAKGVLGYWAVRRLAVGWLAVGWLGGWAVGWLRG